MPARRADASEGATLPGLLGRPDAIQVYDFGTLGNSPSQKRRAVGASMAQLEEAGAAMNDCVQLEIAIECGRHSELQAWAERLHTTPEDLALRAIAAWLTEMDEDAQHRE